MSDANLTLDEVMFRAACLRAKEAGEFANNDQWAVLYAVDSAAKLEAEVKALREAGVKVCDQLDDTRSQLAALILKRGK